MKAVFFFTMLIVAGGRAFGATTDGGVCDPGNPGDPGSARIEALGRDADCASKDDFRNSCAYRNYLRGQQREKIAENAKQWSENMGRIFDASANFGTRESYFRDLRDAISKPGFYEFLDWWATHDRPNFSPSARPPENVPDYIANSGNFSTFVRTINLMSVVEPTNMVRSTLELLALFPEAERAKLGLDELKGLLRATYTSGQEFRISHLAGCDSFYAKMSQSSKTMKHFGPRLRAGDFTAYPAERKIAEGEAERSTAQYRGIANVTKNLAVCGTSDVSVRHASEVVYRSCPVNLPMLIFPDNESKLSGKAAKTLTDAITSDDCYKKMVAQGLKVSKIAVATSANTLKNTKNYCARDFRSLSDDRANAVIGAMRNFCPGQPIAYSANSRGENGDGTTGDCAYVAVPLDKPSAGSFEVDEMSEVDQGGAKTTKKVTRSFAEVFAPAYDTENERKALEKNKYAVTTIYFEDRAEAVSGKDYQWSVIPSCRTVEFACR